MATKKESETMNWKTLQLGFLKYYMAHGIVELQDTTYIGHSMEGDVQFGETGDEISINCYLQNNSPADW